MTAEVSLPLNVLVDSKAKHNSMSYNDWEALNYPTLKPLIEDTTKLKATTKDKPQYGFQSAIRFHIKGLQPLLKQPLKSKSHQMKP